MTITGKVFLFLTLILAVIFPALAQPVFEHQKTTQKAYLAEKEKLEGSFEGDKRKPGLIEQVQEAERKRKRLLDQIRIQEERRTLAEESARKLRLYKETEIAFQRDSLADSEIRAGTLKAALSQTDAEINARDAEIKEMDAAVKIDRAFSTDLAQQVADLKAKLETAKTETQKLLSELQDREKELRDIMKKQADDDGDVATTRR